MTISILGEFFYSPYQDNMADNVPLRNLLKTGYDLDFDQLVSDVEGLDNDSLFDLNMFAERIGSPVVMLATMKAKASGHTFCYDRTVQMIGFAADVTKHAAPEEIKECIASLIDGYKSRVPLSLIPAVGMIREKNSYLAVSDKIDSALSRQTIRCKDQKFCHAEILKICDTFKNLKIPKTVEAFTKNLIDELQLEHARTLVVDLLANEGYSAEYTNQLISSLGHDVFVGIIQEKMLNMPSESNGKIYRLMIALGEDKFLTKDFIERCNVMFSKDIAPGFTRYLNKIDRCMDSFPKSVELIVMNYPLVFDNLTNPISRYLFAAAKELNLHIDLFHGEMDFLVENYSDDKKISRAVALSDGYGEILNHCRTEHKGSLIRRSRYAIAVESISKIGAIEIKGIISDIDEDVFSDIYKGKSPANIVEYIKAFPQIKGRVLEDQLGI